MVKNKKSIRRADATEDQKVDADNDLKFLRMGEREPVSDYIARARGLATKCALLGVQVTSRELAYYTVRGINNNTKTFTRYLRHNVTNHLKKYKKY